MFTIFIPMIFQQFFAFAVWIVFGADSFLALQAWRNQASISSPTATTQEIAPPTVSNPNVPSEQAAYASNVNRKEPTY